MLLSRRDFRAMVFYEYVKKSTIDDCYESLTKTFGEAAPSKSLIESYYKLFKKTCAYLNDESGKPRITRVITTEYVDGVRRLITKDNQRVQCSEIEKKFNISTTILRTVLKDYLHFTKRWDFWIPKVLDKDMKKDRIQWCTLMIQTFDNGVSERIADIVTGSEIWLYCYEANEFKNGTWSFDVEETIATEKKKLPNIIEKRMIASYFTKSGYFATILMDANKYSRVTVPWVTKTCLPRLVHEWKSTIESEDREMIIHHEQTIPYTAAKSIEFIHENGARLLPHPPYSPDLAPSDYFLFPRAREALHGKHFSTAEDAVFAFQDYVNALPVETWEQSFVTWFKRIKKCLRTTEGNYLDDV